MDRIKIAFLGAGDVAQRDYLPEFHRLADRAELVAICGRTPERVRAVAEQYQIPAWYTDYERLLLEAEVEAIINLTPIQLHPETTLAALQAGKHVYTEKPVASTLNEVERLRTEALARDLTVVCAPCVMLFPQVRFAQKLLAAGDLGGVYSAAGQGLMGVPPWRGYPSDPTPFFAKGGGPALDMGVYPLHALTGLLGPAKRVTAMISHVLYDFTLADGPYQGRTIPIEVDDNWQLILDFGGARLATLSANSCVVGTRTPQLELRGLSGSVALDLIDVSAPVEVLRADAGWERIQLPQTGRLAGPDHHLGVEHLVDCLQQRKAPILNIDHARHVIEILEKAAQSAAAGRVLDLETRFPFAPYQRQVE
jgi:predicted dehydrogenase